MKGTGIKPRSIFLGKKFFDFFKYSLKENA